MAAVSQDLGKGLDEVALSAPASAAGTSTDDTPLRWPAVNAGELRDSCLRHVGTVEEFPFGPETSVFKVAGKMFALSALDRTPLSVSVKCEPELAEQLRNSYPAIRPGYHLNKRHWNTVTIGGDLPDQLVQDMIEDSYDLVVSALPRRVREELGWSAGA